MHETIKAARKLLGEEEVIWVHTHETADVGITQYQAAIEAGCDGVDIARSPLSGGAPANPIFLPCGIRSRAQILPWISTLPK